MRSGQGGIHAIRGHIHESPWHIHETRGKPHPAPPRPKNFALYPHNRARSVGQRSLEMNWREGSGADFCTAPPNNPLHPRGAIR